MECCHVLLRFVDQLAGRNPDDTNTAETGSSDDNAKESDLQVCAVAMFMVRCCFVCLIFHCLYCTSFCTTFPPLHGQTKKPSSGWSAE